MHEHAVFLNDGPVVILVIGLYGGLRAKEQRSYFVGRKTVTSWTKKHLGVRLTPHKLRHSYGKHCVDVGADIRVIAEALGHESLESARIYTQVSFERTRALKNF